MWMLAIITVAVCLAVGWTINALLFAQWRVRPLYRWLYRHSAWYRRWMFAQMIRSMERMTHSFAAVAPAAKRASKAFEAFGKALSRAV